MMDIGLELLEKRIKEKLLNELSRTGLLFRLFSRVKDPNSIDEKIIRKGYKSNGRLIQDLIGIRIVTYFSEDINIIVSQCEKLFEKIELVMDQPTTDSFKPLRKNMVCRMPYSESTTFNELKVTKSSYKFIDNTFEIQFRTTFSEGWHEVDHTMRYKCQDDWKDLTTESRMLNGFYATLETSDQALKALFDDIAYHHYKAQQWEAMIRNKLRLRFLLDSLDIDVSSYLTKNPEIGKQLFKIERKEIIIKYVNSTLSFPTTLTNWIYFINFFFMQDSYILSKTPQFLLENFEYELSEKE